AGVRVERSCGFVGKQKRWIVDQSAGDRDPLLLAATQASWIPVRDLCDGELFQQLARTRRPLAAFELRGNEDVLERGQVGQQVEELEDETTMAPANSGQARLAQLGEIGPAYGDRAGRWPVQPRVEVEQGGLAAARGAHDRGELALLDRGRHAVEGARDPALIDLRDVGDANQLAHSVARSEERR